MCDNSLLYLSFDPMRKAIYSVLFLAVLGVAAYMYGPMLLNTLQADVQQ